MENEQQLKIKIKRIEENSFKLCIPEQLDGKLKLGFKCLLSPNEEEDLFTVFLAIKYIDKSVDVLEYAASFIFEVIDLKNMLEKKEGKIRVHPDFIPYLTDLSFDTLRGMIAVKTMGTALASHPLPIINTKKLLEKNNE